MPTFNEAREAFHTNPTRQTASAYITEAIQVLHDNVPDDDETSIPLSPPLLNVFSAASEVAYWLKRDRVQKMPIPKQ